MHNNPVDILIILAVELKLEGALFGERAEFTTYLEPSSMHSLEIKSTHKPCVKCLRPEHPLSTELGPILPLFMIVVNDEDPTPVGFVEPVEPTKDLRHVPRVIDTEVAHHHLQWIEDYEAGLKTGN